jgi:hypothetical protein
MLEPYRIVHSIMDAYRGLPEKLARITALSAEWYRSHGREPKTANPLAGGNVSPVTHYMRYCGLFEAGMPGAGRMLNNRVFAALDAEFAERDLLLSDPVDLEVNVIKQGCDVQTWLAKFDIDTASLPDLVMFQNECDESTDAILAAKARARARQRMIESERRIKAVQR